MVELVGGVASSDITVGLNYGGGADAADFRGPAEVVVPAGDSSAEFKVTVFNDDIFERTERIKISIDEDSLPSGVKAGGPDEVVWEIRDGDDKPGARLQPEVLVSESKPTGRAPGTMTKASDFDQRIYYSFGWGSFRITAIDGVDYKGARGRVRWTTAKAYSTSFAVPIFPIDDSIDEPREAFKVSLLTKSGAPHDIGQPDHAYITIVDDDPTSVSMTLDTGADIDEDGGDAELSLKLGRGLFKPESLTVPIVLGGTARPGSDYRLVCSKEKGVTCAHTTTGTPKITFTGGKTESSSEVTVRVEALDDGFDEGSETITLTVEALDGDSGTNLDGGAIVVAGEVSLTIADDDPGGEAEPPDIPPPPTLSLSWVGDVYGVVENGSVSVRVSSDRPITHNDLEVSLAASAGNHYDVTLTPSVAVIKVGDSSADATLHVRDDRINQTHGRARVSIEPQPEYQIDDSAGSVRLPINDNDPPLSQIVLTVSRSSIREDAGPTDIDVFAAITGNTTSEKDLNIKVVISPPPPSKKKKVRYRSVDPINITIPAGHRQGRSWFYLAPIDDDVHDSDTKIRLSGSVRGGPAVADARLLLIDDDNPHPESIELKVHPRTIKETDSPRQVKVTAVIQYGKVFTDDVTLLLTAGDRSQFTSLGVEGIPAFELEIPAGATKGTASFRLAPIRDRVTERNMEVKVKGVVGGIGGVTVLPASVIVQDVPLPLPKPVPSPPPEPRRSVVESATPETSLIVVNPGHSPDLGVATSLAARLPNSALVFAESETLPDSTVATLNAVAPDRVFVVGDGKAISKNLIKQIGNLVGDHVGLERITGSSRTRMSVAAAQAALQLEAIDPDPERIVIVANGGRVFDVGVAAALAAPRDEAVVVYVSRDKINGAAQTFIAQRNPEKLFIVGSTDSISADAEETLVAIAPQAHVIRINGPNRVQVATAAARRTIDSRELAIQNTFVIVNGWKHKQLGIAAVIAARYENSGLLYTKGEELDDVTLRFLRVNPPGWVIIVGGHDSVDQNVEKQIAAVTGGYSRVKRYDNTGSALAAEVAQEVLAGN